MLNQFCEGLGSRLPVLMDSNRDLQLNIRTKPGWKTMVEAAATRRGMTLSEFVRYCIELQLPKKKEAKRARTDGL